MSQDQGEEKVVDKTYKQKVNQRKGHRSFVTLVLRESKQHLESSEDRRHLLAGLRVTLLEKMETLQKFDDEIVSYLSEEDELEAEIGRASDLRQEMQSIVFQIDSRLKIEVNPPQSVATSSYAKLPKLTLKTFSGSPLEFQAFWDSFEAAVHTNGSLEKIMKFNYLRSYLQEPALDAISGLSLTSENYDEAVGILQDQFGNKQLLITSNMEILLSLPTVTSIENIGKVREMYNKIETSVRNLKSLHVEKEHYGPVLISIVMAKLPEEIRLVISRGMPVNEEWKTDEFLLTLKKEVESRELCSYMKSKKKPGSKTKNDDVGEEQEAEFTGSTLMSTSTNRKNITT